MQVRQEYELVRIDGDEDTLKEHPRNPRRGDIEAIDESIEVNGWYGAVVAQRSTGYILAGNHRYRAARARGASEIPTVFVDVDDEAALRILLADNKTADLGTYDEELLGQLLDELGDLKGTGYRGQEIAVALDGVAQREEAAVEAAGDEGEVPDDVYTPEYGIMIVCESEQDQAELYDRLTKLMTAKRGGLPDRKLRVVAV